MDYELANEMWDAIGVIEARETLLALKIGDYGKMKQQGREKFHRDIFKKAFPARQYSDVKDVMKKVNNG